MSVLMAAVPGAAFAALAGPGQSDLSSTTTVFGADLTKPVNSNRTCWGGLLGPEFYAQQAAMNGLSFEQYVWVWQTYYGWQFVYPSCTWWNVGKLPAVGQDMTNLGDNVVPLGGGTLTAVRIKTGPITGKMQVVTLRFIRHPSSTGLPGGPFFVAASQVFTPQANTISEIPMNIPVKHELDKASGVYNYDVMALSVLDPDVPMPFWSSGGDPSTTGAILAKYPAWQPGVEQYQDVGSLNGAGSVLIQGVVTKSNDSNSNVDPIVPGKPVVRLPKGVNPTVNRSGTQAYVPLYCAPGSVCNGLLQLSSRKAVAAAKKTTYGRARFAIGAGQTGKIKVRLSKQARKKLRSGKTLKAWANVTMDAGGTTSLRLTLRAR